MIVVGLFQPVLFCSILTFPVGRGTFGRMSREASIPSYIPANLAALISCSHYVSFVCICTLINQILDSFLGINPNAREKKKLLFKSSGNSSCVRAILKALLASLGK